MTLIMKNERELKEDEDEDSDEPVHKPLTKPRVNYNF
jgi:hypothetical protein